jgi:hypothetical protein
MPKTYNSVGLILLAGLVSPALAQSDNSLSSQMREWESRPENPSLREMCSTSQSYATSLVNMKKQGSSVSMLLRWGEQEAERSATQLPSEPLLPVGTMMMITKQIQLLYTAAPIYNSVRGGFPQWVYRSCLKGQRVD